MRPYGEFPITFDLHKNGTLLSKHSVRNNQEEQAVLAVQDQQTTQHNRFDARHDIRPEQTIPEIQALKLATIYCDGSTTLVSLTHKTVLFDNDDGEKSYPDVPHVHLAADDENKAADEWFGTEDGKADGDGFPGWPAIFHYLNNHPERLDTAEANPDEE